MYFLLLQGTHLEYGKKFQAETEQDNEGRLRIKNRPVIESKRDLVAAFGAEKFRLISKGEAEALSKTGGLSEQVQDSADSDPVTSEESEVAKVVKKGAVGVAEPPGIDSTHKFPELTEWPTVTAYYKRGKGYFIADNGEVVTEAAIKRGDVVEWVRSYMEG